MIQTDGQTELL